MIFSYKLDNPVFVSLSTSTADSLYRSCGYRTEQQALWRRPDRPDSWDPPLIWKPFCLWVKLKSQQTESPVSLVSAHSSNNNTEIYFHFELCSSQTHLQCVSVCGVKKAELTQKTLFLSDFGLMVKLIVSVCVSLCNEEEEQIVSWFVHRWVCWGAELCQTSSVKGNLCSFGEKFKIQTCLFTILMSYTNSEICIFSISE